MQKELRFALKQTLPVLFGYLFLGIGFGIMLQREGYNFIWAFFCSLFIYAGSGQYLLVSLLAAGTPLYMVAVMTLFINSRHIFYGLSLIEKFCLTGRARPYMIFSLTDETYSLLCSVKFPAGVQPGRAMVLMAVLDHGYWILGSVLGALLGQLIPFDFTGVDFAMTALFVVLFIEQWMDAKSKLPALIGLASGLVFLLLLGPDRFILPSLCCTVAALMLIKPYVQKKSEVDA